MHAYTSSTIPPGKYLLSVPSAGRVDVCVQLEGDMCLQINNTRTELIIPEARQILDERVGVLLGKAESALNLLAGKGCQSLEMNMSTQACMQPFTEFSPHPPERQSSLL